jgi:hypothetical protein
MKPWWAWDWDRHDASKAMLAVPLERVTRWRRGWVTLYRLTSVDTVEWRLFLPFNFNVGIQRSR